MYIPTSLLNIVACAAEEDTRYALQTIQVEVKDGVPMLVATDSKKLMFATWKYECEAKEVSPGPDREILVPRWAFDVAMKLVRVRPQPERFNGFMALSDRDGMFELQLPAFCPSEQDMKFQPADDLIAITGKLTDGKFPNWRAIIFPVDKQIENGGPVSLDHRFVRDGLTALAECTGHSEYGWPRMLVGNTNGAGPTVCSMKGKNVEATLYIMQIS